METYQIKINGTSAKTEKRNGHLSCDQREPSPLIPKAYYSDVIKAGTSVTSSKPTGPVTFNGGHIVLKGNEVTLEGETTITSGTVFEMIKF